MLCPTGPSTSVATRLYVYYVRPTMEYACAVWHGSLREDIALSLERIQASAARRLLRADWFTPKETLLEQLGWPALRWRREISSLTLFHKLLHSRPEPLHELLFPFAHTTSSRCRAQDRVRPARGGELRTALSRRGQGGSFRCKTVSTLAFCSKRRHDEEKSFNGHSFLPAKRGASSAEPP